MIRDWIERIPEGYSEGYYAGVRYGISKTVFNGGRSVTGRKNNK